MDRAKPSLNTVRRTLHADWCISRHRRPRDCMRVTNSVAMEAIRCQDRLDMSDIRVARLQNSLRCTTLQSK